MSQVLMYTKTPCSYCSRARKLLQRRGIDFTEIPVDRDPEQERQMIERSGSRSVPQVFIDDRHIGGYADLAELDADGELEPLLGR